MNQASEQPATAANDRGADDSLARSGAITYMHIPAGDVRQAAAFYRDVFGWRIHNADSGRPGFEDPGGHLGGAWVSHQAVSSEPGLLPYIYVDEVEVTIARIQEHGGVVVSQPRAEGLLTVAEFRDPAGNVMGIWHDTTR